MVFYKTNTNKMSGGNSNKISYRVFNSYANRKEDFEEVQKIPRYLKRIDVDDKKTSKKTLLRYKDARLSYKNRRNINKDWKDFNNQSNT